MKRIRNKQRIDNLKTELRNQPERYGRWIYLTLLIGLFLWMFNMFFGHYIFFRADGIVTQEQIEIGVSYLADIVEMNVQEGDTVIPGQALAQLQSMQVLNQASNLSEKRIDVQIKISEKNSRIKVLKTIIPIAESRANGLSNLLQNEHKAINNGLTNNRNLSDLIQSEFQARLFLEQSRTEIKYLTHEENNLQRIDNDLMKVEQQLAKLFNKGIVMAPESGTIIQLSKKGSVLREGEPLAELLVGKPYVLGYIEPGAFYEIKLGQRVKIIYGFEVTYGQITKILPTSSTLPSEFQRTFRPKDRSRVIRIDLDKEAHIPPTFTKVSVASENHWFW